MDKIKDYLKSWSLFFVDEIDKSFLPEVSSNEKISKEEAWRILSEEISSCKKCPYFAHKKHVVIGDGNIESKVLLIGEAPWKDEDAQGKPFVGKAGKLLTKMLKYVNIDRKDIYIANVVKCIPPARRAPEDDVIRVCSPYLLKQIELISPLIIVTLGRVATQFLLNTKTPISRIRGQWQKWRGIWVLPTFHPSYLLQNPSKSPLVAEDMKTLYKKMKELGVAK